MRHDQRNCSVCRSSLKAIFDSEDYLLRKPSSLGKAYAEARNCIKDSTYDKRVHIITTLIPLANLANVVWKQVKDSTQSEMLYAYLCNVIDSAGECHIEEMINDIHAHLEKTVMASLVQLFNDASMALPAFHPEAEDTLLTQ